MFSHLQRSTAKWNSKHSSAQNTVTNAMLESLPTILSIHNIQSFRFSNGPRRYRWRYQPNNCYELDWWRQHGLRTTALNRQTNKYQKYWNSIIPSQQETPMIPTWFNQLNEHREGGRKKLYRANKNSTQLITKISEMFQPYRDADHHK